MGLGVRGCQNTIAFTSYSVSYFGGLGVTRCFPSSARRHRSEQRSRSQMRRKRSGRGLHSRYCQAVGRRTYPLAVRDNCWQQLSDRMLFSLRREDYTVSCLVHLLHNPSFDKEVEQGHVKTYIFRTHIKQVVQ